MNKLLLCTRRIRTALLVGLSLGHALCATAQGTPTIQAADYIVAVVNSEPVTNNEVQTMRGRILRELAAQGIQPPSAQQLIQQALDRLINEKAQLQQAREQGIKIDDDQVDQAEASMAANNRLTREVFHERLQQQGLTLAVFRQQLRDQLALSRLREREVDSRIRISDQDIDQFLKTQT